MKIPTCGILVNAKDYFVPYIDYIVEESKKKYFDISFFHTNDNGWWDNNFKNNGLPISNSLQSVIDGSDIIFSLGYWNIISRKQIEAVPLGIVNVHHSFRLKYRGRHMSTHAIRSGEKYHGSTIHFIDEKLDEGKIIDTAPCKIDDNDTSESLFYKSNQVGLDLIKKNFRDIITNNVKLTDISHDPNFVYFKGRDLDHEIPTDVLGNITTLGRYIKSMMFDNAPAPYFLIGDKKVYVKMSEYDDGILRRN
mgnify:CR=1 FL=1|tara:strand:- start:3569 stop:4318 length:750 start_codon:yes stop_codon:yes gene_type:complete